MPSLPADWPLLAFGIALCLMGWSIYWIGLHLAGGLAGAGFSVMCAWASSILFNIEQTQAWLLPLAGILGLCFGIFLIRGLHRFFFFLIGATLGLGAGQSLFRWGQENLDWMQNHPVVWQAALVIVCAGLCGLVMLRGSRWVVALLTSAIGSLMIVMFIDHPLALLMAIPLALSSFALQAGILHQIAARPRPAQHRSGEA